MVNVHGQVLHVSKCCNVMMQIRMKSHVNSKISIVIGHHQLDIMQVLVALTLV